MNTIALAHTQALKQQRQAAAYVAVALEVIPLAKSADDLRTWWNEEQQHRGEYGLTEAQAGILIGACREHVRRLGETRGVQP
ncbi:hypothetical protein IVB16_28685 [Bradyrhizobium sp. 183]|uniref:hypothetical protein n=1 Tax=unclassified Bradyrhizobium TaxID=2631580 RepID=UPI0020003DD6|nr:MULTISPECIES: hypothetical protein [unclassified Bradyrhizobium]UPJ78814.1 hypothetical protein IVB17_28690 [Bradyrhizobium sp. 184]UPJ86607.1 hypothetical protein IVB16_28685 [Bradyrhizobium sp. 183]